MLEVRDQGPLPLPQHGLRLGPASALGVGEVRGNHGEVVKGPFLAWPLVPSFLSPALFFVSAKQEGPEVESRALERQR